MFSCEICEISKNTFFTEHLWTTASKNPDYLANVSCPDVIGELLRLLKLNNIFL